MESKTKHRILGIVVVAGLAVLMYPFMQGSHTTANEQVLVKAPPFPDQAIQVTSSDTEEFVNSAPADVTPASSAGVQQIHESSVEEGPDGVIKQDATPSPNVAEPSLTNPPSATDNPAEKNQSTDQQPMSPEQKPAEKSSAPADSRTSGEKADDVSSSQNVEGEIVAPLVENERVKSAPVKAAVKKPAKKTLATKRVGHKKLAKTVIQKQEKPVIHSRVTSKTAISAYRRAPLDNNGLLQLKHAAYVIQLGSFKQKTNALKLVNKLRANGYRAFIQHVPAATGEGENTRVFVGPEHQQASARLVASDLEKELKLHGIVISYKPFTL